MPSFQHKKPARTNSALRGLAFCRYLYSLTGFSCLLFCFGGCGALSPKDALFSQTHQTFFRESNVVAVRSQDTALPGGWAGVEVGETAGTGVKSEETPASRQGSRPAVVISPGKTSSEVEPEETRLPGAHSIGPGRPRLGTPRLLPAPSPDVEAIEVSAGPGDLGGTSPSSQAVDSESDGDDQMEVPAIAEPSIPETVVPEQSVREKTVLDRLRGLYPSRLEESSSDLFRKNLRRLQNPWNRGSEEPPSIEVPATPPEQTVEVPELTSGASVDGTITPIVDGSGTEQLLGQLIEAAESEINTWPRDERGQPEDSAEWRKAQADLRLLYQVANRPADAASAIGAMPPAEQEFWQALMLGLSYYRSSGDPNLDRDAQLNATAEQLRAAVRHLQAMAPLSIRRLTFASRIQGFGSIETYPAAEFNPGQPVLIYAEIDNFRSNLNSVGTYRSEFMAVVDLLRIDEDDPEEQVVESIRVPSIVDESLTQRTDYFQSYELTIPSHLTSGRYQVRLRIRDQQSSQQAESIVEFTVR